MKQTTQENKELTKSTNFPVTIDDEELVRMCMDNAELGTDNLGAEMPTLKIHSAGKSSNNFLTDGKEPSNGNFFYKPTRQQFEEVYCHILTISRGFRAPSIEDETREVFNQILAGLLINNNNLDPFMMYFSGLRLENMWNFGKELRVYTRAKPVPIPMFALTVKMTTRAIEHSKSNKFGKAWIVDFEVVKDDKGVPEFIRDKELFIKIRDMVDTVAVTLERIAASKSGEEELPPPLKPKNQARSAEEVEEALEPEPPEDDTDDIDSGDTPF